MVVLVSFPVVCGSLRQFVVVCLLVIPVLGGGYFAKVGVLRRVKSA